METQKTGYVDFINEVLTKGVSAWWNQLSKEELVNFISDNPYITADTLRQMITNSNVKLMFNVKYDSVTNMSAVNFFNSAKEEK